MCVCVMQVPAGRIGVRREQRARQEAHRFQARRAASHQGVGGSASSDERETTLGVPVSLA